jgi:hypothetical protein
LRGYVWGNRIGIGDPASEQRLGLYRHGRARPGYPRRAASMTGPTLSPLVAEVQNVAFDTAARLRTAMTTSHLSMFHVKQAGA